MDDETRASLRRALRSKVAALNKGRGPNGKTTVRSLSKMIQLQKDIAEDVKKDVKMSEAMGIAVIVTPNRQHIR